MYSNHMTNESNLSNSKDVHKTLLVIILITKSRKKRKNKKVRKYVTSNHLMSMWPHWDGLFVKQPTLKIKCSLLKAGLYRLTEGEDLL